MRRLTYRQIADDIADRITKGDYPPGPQLPSWRELAELYSVHVSTIAKAIVLLEDRGVIYGHAGRGTFVVDPAEQQP
jgi:GntR family transcriptional regulator